MPKDVKKLIQKLYNNDKLYMEKCLKIRTKEGSLVPFKMNPMQEKTEKLIYEHQVSKGKPVRVIILKARQHGISTYAEGKIFKKTATNPFRNALIIAHEDKATQNLFAMSKLFYESLPPLLRPMKKYSNESALVFENPTNNDEEKYKNPGLRSKITVATAKNVDTGRSATTHSLHASEVAFWDNPEVLMLGIMQCVPDTPNTEIYIESTANGIGGYFYDMWQKAVKGENDFLPIFLAWFENPEYSTLFESKAQKKAFINSLNEEEKILIERFKVTAEQLHWRRRCIANKCNGDIEQFHQEYPSTPEEAFIATGRPKFSIQSLQKYRTNQEKPIITGYLERKGNTVTLIPDPKGYVSIWDNPKKDKFYVVGSDVSEGLATGDYSCGIVLDEDFNLVASWHGHIDPDLFGDELVNIAIYYNNAYLGIESNNHGLTTLKSVLRHEYWNIYYQKSYDKIAEKVSQKIGWGTNKRTKPLMINTLAEYIRECWLGIKWDLLISELFTYVIEEDGGTNAQSGSHDDSVMALAIALQLLLEGRGEDYTPEIPRDQLNNDKISDLSKEGDYGYEEYAQEEYESEEFSN
ncbi:MAG: hypothetical protein PHY47_12875 [Lachnospiraceae bacterium]|nr:hypothetical protein [Lachnospiraceae bacterium]